MIKYFAFGWMGHDAMGGWGDLICETENLAEAIEAIHANRLLIELAEIVQINEQLETKVILEGAKRPNHWSWKEAT